MRVTSTRIVLALLLLLVPALLLAEEEAPPSAWLGVRLGGLVETDSGVAVSRVFSDSPAAEGGLRARDVITHFGGEPVSSLRELIGKIQSHDPGSWLPVTVARQGDEVELDVKLSTRPKVLKAGGMRNGWIGVEAIDLPASLREHFGAPHEAGVMISDLVSGSPAEVAGFRLGDIVYSVDGYEVKGVRVLRELVQGGGVENSYEFEVARDGNLLVLEAEIEAAPERAR
jgi:serine protease Do